MGGNAMSKRLERAEKTGVFALEEADLDEIPPRLFELQKIVRVLDLSGNKIGKLSPKVSTFTVLKNLNVSRNRLTAIAVELFALRSLETLNLSDNKIRELPREIGQLGKLKKLLLGKNQLTRLPEEIAGLRSLEVLECPDNQLGELPHEVGELGALEELTVEGNRLRGLPEEVGNLKEIRVLKASRNQLASLPRTLFTRTKIARVEIEDNPFTLDQLQELPGFSEERRKAVVDKAMQGGASYKMVDE